MEILNDYIHRSFYMVFQNVRLYIFYGSSYLRNSEEVIRKSYDSRGHSFCYFSPCVGADPAWSCWASANYGENELAISSRISLRPNLLLNMEAKTTARS